MVIIAATVRSVERTKRTTSWRAAAKRIYLDPVNFEKSYIPTVSGRVSTVHKSARSDCHGKARLAFPRPSRHCLLEVTQEPSEGPSPRAQAEEPWYPANEPQGRSQRRLVVLAAKQSFPKFEGALRARRGDGELPRTP